MPENRDAINILVHKLLALSLTVLLGNTSTYSQSGQSRSSSDCICCQVVSPNGHVSVGMSVPCQCGHECAHVSVGVSVPQGFLCSCPSYLRKRLQIRPYRSLSISLLFLPLFSSVPCNHNSQSLLPLVVLLASALSFHQASVSLHWLQQLPWVSLESVPTVTPSFYFFRHSGD